MADNNIPMWDPQNNGGQSQAQNNAGVQGGTPQRQPQDAQQAASERPTEIMDNAFTNSHDNAGVDATRPLAQAEGPAGTAEPTSAAADATRVTQPVQGAQPVQATQPTQTEPGLPLTPPEWGGQYRPAPQYGAYGPVPQQNQTGDAQSQNQPQNQNGGMRQGPFPLFGANRNQGNGSNVPGGQGTGNGGTGNGGNGYNPFNPYPGNNSGDPNKANNGMGGKAGNLRHSAALPAVVTGVVAAGVAVALSLGIGFAALTNGWVTLPTSSSLAALDSNTSGSGTAQVEAGESPDWQAVAKNVSDSVVAIQTTIQSNGQTGTAKGSGAIISKDGDIVTNNHVVSGAQDIQVTLSNGQIYAADLVGTDVTTDLAVIKLNDAPDNLKPVEFADSDKLAVGEEVMAIGNPLGYENTATTGIVSALNRPVTVMDDENNEIVTNAVQIDAAINPGNSGGPTFNAAGQVIGINSSIATASGSSGESGSIGIGFAIPSNLVKRVANEIVENGSVQHVALGVTVQTGTATSDGVTRAGAKVTRGSATGSAVVSGSPADKAGIKEDDVIVAYNGETVNSTASLLGFVRASAMGDTVKLTIVRGGNTMDVEVTLDQAEEAVNGSNRSDSSSGSSQNDQNNQNNQNNQNGQNGQNDDSYGNLLDPFGFGW